MSFSTTIFILAFLPLALLGYYVSPKKIKNYFLLFVSLVFYVVGGTKYIILLLFSIVFNYVAGILLDKLEHKPLLRKTIFILGILYNLFPLLYYKYFSFTVLNIDNILHLHIPQNNVVLPLGISFFTFKALSYIIDVYRKKANANRNMVQISLYIAIFPQIISGPIMPYIDMQDQIIERTVTLEFFSYGIRRFSYGLAKKVLIADILGQTADKIFTAAHLLQVDMLTVWLGIICYTLQIFFDFAGYSDMAIGLGKMFGFTFMENFNFPYISKSISEFWRRWHISLSSWFRNYLYIPLGGNRKGNVYFNLFVVFLVTGIWHGASWTFVIWGLWHGLFIIVERVVRNNSWYIRIPSIIKWGITLFIIVMGWVLFRASSITDAINYYKMLFGIIRPVLPEFTFAYYINYQILFTFIIAGFLSTPLLHKITIRIDNKPIFSLGRVILVNVLLILGIIFVVNSTYSPFIYFQF